MSMRGLLFVGLVAVVGCNKSAGTNGSPGKSGDAPDEWTHKELSDTLARNGFKHQLVPTHVGGSHGPAVFLVVEGSGIDVTDKFAANIAFDRKSPDVVYCQLRKSAQDAREKAAATAGGAFASGRFLFGGSPEALARVRAALP